MRYFIIFYIIEDDPMADYRYVTCAKYLKIAKASFPQLGEIYNLIRKEWSNATIGGITGITEVSEYDYISFDA